VLGDANDESFEPPPNVEKALLPSVPPKPLLLLPPNPDFAPPPRPLNPDVEDVFPKPEAVLDDLAAAKALG
jgi:hypothetical protein